MTVEASGTINTLNTSLPTAADLIAEGDDHIRLIKTDLKLTWPNYTGAVTSTHVEANYLTGVTSAIQTQINAKAGTVSPTFTGTVVLPATTSIGAVTGTEISYLSGVTSAIQPQFGNVTTLLAGKAGIAGPVAYTGTHDFTGATATAATQTAGDNSTKVATTAFVVATAFSSSLPGQGGNSGKYLTTNGTTASWGVVVPWLTPNDVSGTTQAAVQNQLYRLNNVAATTVTLPTSAADGAIIQVQPTNGLLTNIVNPQAGQSINGQANGDGVYLDALITWQFFYNANTNTWRF